MWQMLAPPPSQKPWRQQCGRVVSGCSGLELVATTVVLSQSAVKSWRRQVAVQSVYKAYLFFSFVLE